MPLPMLTVMFATYHRLQLLQRVLETYRGLRDPAGGWKLVVIDNSPDGGARSLVDSFRGSLPLTYLSESRPGKNAALNAGLSTIEGDLVVFTDDDVFPQPDWLRVLRAAADGHPAADVLAGAIVPRWENTPASWILEWVRLEPVFAITNPAWPEGPIAPNWVFGPNMAIRSRVFDAGHRFDQHIGPRGEEYAMGSETELVERLARLGMQAWFSPEAVVEHFVRRQQLTRAWILGRARRYGRGQYRLELDEIPADARTWGGVPRYFMRELLEAGVRRARAGLAGDRRASFDAAWDFEYTLGRIIEARRMRHEIPGPRS